MLQLFIIGVAASLYAFYILPFFYWCCYCLYPLLTKVDDAFFPFLFSQSFNGLLFNNSYSRLKSFNTLNKFDPYYLCNILDGRYWIRHIHRNMCCLFPSLFAYFYCIPTVSFNKDLLDIICLCIY